MAWITKLEKINRFLSYFGNLKNIEISSWPMAYGIEELENRNKTSEAYFLWELRDVKKWYVPRHTKDDDIFQKRYFYIDFDIRQWWLEKTWECLTDNKLLEIELELRKVIDWIDMLKDRTFIVFTGNGFHYHRISKEPVVVNKSIYTRAMELILEKVRTALTEKDIDIKVDSAPKNIARLARLPYTINHARVRKYWEYGIEEWESYVVEARKDVRTDLLSRFPDLAEERWEEIVVQEYKPKKAFEVWYWCTIDAINEIPIEDLIYKYCWVPINKNGKDFISLKDWWPVGMYKKWNCVAWSGTHYILEPTLPVKWYNSYSFVKDHYCNWEDSSVFTRFRDNYQHIREIDDNNRKQYGEQAKEEKNKEFRKDISTESKVITDDEIEDDRSKNMESIKDVKGIYRWGIMVDFMVDELNEKIKRIHLWTLNIIVWSPNAWKTTFSYLMMKHNLTRWLKVWFLSYEMQFRDIIEQYYFRQIWAMDRFMNARITEEDNIKTNKHKEELVMDKNFLHYECLDSNLEILKTHIDKMTKFWANVVFIDNLIKIRRTESELLDNTKVIEYLYRVSHERDIAIIILHHTDKVAAIKNLLSFRGTGDVQIKPDNLYYIKRPGLSIENWESTELEKAELDVRKVKQRLWKASLEEVEIYFYKWEYYSLEEYMTKIRSF